MEERKIKASLRTGMSINRIYKLLKNGKRSSFSVILKARPEMFEHPEEVSFKQMEIDMEATLCGEAIFLSKHVAYGYMGDEDGFGVEPDSYLTAVVAPDGTFISLLKVI